MLHRQCDRAAVYGNTARGNGDAGLSLYETSDCRVYDNKFFWNDRESLFYYFAVVKVCEGILSQDKIEQNNNPDGLRAVWRRLYFERVQRRFSQHLFTGIFVATFVHLGLSVKGCLVTSRSQNDGLLSPVKCMFNSTTDDLLRTPETKASAQ